MLCDCPGLVFPSFVNSKAEMYCCGVLPISQLRHHVAPCQLMCQRIPKLVFDRTYGIKVPLPSKLSKETDPVDVYLLLEVSGAIWFMRSCKILANQICRHMLDIADTPRQGRGVRIRLERHEIYFEIMLTENCCIVILHQKLSMKRRSTRTRLHLSVLVNKRGMKMIHRQSPITMWT